jgi:hypothetical protein
MVGCSQQSWIPREAKHLLRGQARRDHLVIDLENEDRANPHRRPALSVERLDYFRDCFRLKRIYLRLRQVHSTDLKRALNLLKARLDLRARGKFACPRREPPEKRAADCWKLI